MIPSFGRMVVVFSAPSFLDLPRHGPFWRCRRCTAKTRVSNTWFVMQWYGSGGSRIGSYDR